MRTLIQRVLGPDNQIRKAIVLVPDDDFERDAIERLVAADGGHLAVRYTPSSVRGQAREAPQEMRLTFTFKTFRRDIAQEIEVHGSEEKTS